MSTYKSTNMNVMIPMHPEAPLNARCTGYFSCTPDAYDLAIGTYLPSSPERLRQILAEIVGTDPEYLRHLTNVSTLLLVLADMNGWK